MRRKIVLVIAVATLSAPVGVAVVGSPAFAATRTHSISVDKQHKETVDSSKDTSPEASSKDASKDRSPEVSGKDASKDSSTEASASAAYRAG